MEKNELEQNKEEIAKYKEKASQLERTEQILYKLSEIEHKAKKEDNFKLEVQSLEMQYQSNDLRFDQSWAFLKHIGAFDLISSDNSKLTLLNDEDPDFKVLLRFLDDESSLRISIKIGVLYVGKGQFDQKAIFFNTKGSEEYEELMKKLGKSFSNAELHKSLSLQPNILYYANGIYELVFHVATGMTTVLTDDQQLGKKKYIGNDSIHIVWDENDREYRPGTITSAFNFVHIIIHPLRNGLYRIRIRKKKDEKGKQVGFFGPLLTGMMLPMNLLGTLLRYTSINARKAITNKKFRIVNPLSERRKIIERITSKHGLRAGVKGEINQAFINKFINTTK